MSKKEIQGPFTSHYEQGQIICSAGEKVFDLYKIYSGRVMVFVTEGTKVTPISILEEGEYIGELSFFDKTTRSAHLICLEKSTLVTIPISELEKHFPDWLETIALSIVGKLRRATELIRQKGIRRKNVESIKPLSIEEQRSFFQILKHYREEKGLPSL